MTERAMYIWRLSNVVAAEGSVVKIVEKAKRARLNALWVKLADGASPSPNTQGVIGQRFSELIQRCHTAGIKVWGWHVPHCINAARTSNEVASLAALTQEFAIDGLIMDAEGGPEYFQGGRDEADQYGREMKALALSLNRPLALSSNDIPQNLRDWLPRFNKIAFHADINFPQVYYGGSASVVSRLERAASANAHVTIPFAPVGVAWVGDGGGCVSASACAERARTFIRLVHERGHPTYSFWHWAGAPMEFWAVLNTSPV